MKNLHAVRQRLDKLVAAIEQRQPQAPIEFETFWADEVPEGLAVLLRKKGMSYEPGRTTEATHEGTGSSREAEEYSRHPLSCRAL